MWVYSKQQATILNLAASTFEIKFCQRCFSISINDISTKNKNEHKKLKIKFDIYKNQQQLK